MWVYVSMSFSIRSKQKKALCEGFVRELVKDGFSKLYPTMYVRHCTTLSNAMVHRRRVMEKILPFGKVSVILVADQQADLAYHYCGTIRNQKNERKLPEIPDLIEFF